jgi:hypothetical protein
MGANKLIGIRDEIEEQKAGETRQKGQKLRGDRE